MAGKVILKDIVELKKCSVEEFIHIAAEKGITISKGEESELSFTELRVIDPSIAYKLRYKRPERQTTAKQPSTTKESLVTKEEGKTTQQTLNSLESLGSLSQKATDAPKENPDFQKKILILEELISMVNYADMMTIEDVHKIRQKWEDCGIGRGKEFKDLYKRYEFTLKNLYSHLSIDSSILAAEYQVNFERKIRICEALESIANDASIKIVADSLDALTLQWREAGPVEENDSKQINERFK